MAWFSSRLAYARSVAVTSIVGYVVGLGDRHASNILLDQKSGELIHIDLGIAFDQVSTLVKPELDLRALVISMIPTFHSLTS